MPDQADGLRELMRARSGVPVTAPEVSPQERLPVSPGGKGGEVGRDTADPATRRPGFFAALAALWAPARGAR